MLQRTPTPHSVQHPSSVSALRADPPSPTRGRRRDALLPINRCRHAFHPRLDLQRHIFRVKARQRQIAAVEP
ncbi:MAG: hypothetical protein E5Y77_31315 [Mesorhizobium sp.]|nr:MAG: hypothetical protein E5Y77_31315 [Mesorhizobium sp.]